MPTAESQLCQVVYYGWLVCSPFSGTRTIVVVLWYSYRVVVVPVQCLQYTSGLVVGTTGRHVQG